MSAEALVNFLFPIITMVGGWFIGRKKQVAETKTAEAGAKTAELDNVEKAIKIWREMSASLEEKFKEQEEKFKEQVETNNALIQRNNDLEEEVRSLRADFDIVINNCPNNCPVPTKIKRTTKL